MVMIDDLWVVVALVVTLVSILLSILMMKRGPGRSAWITSLLIGCASVMFGEALSCAGPLAYRIITQGWASLRPMDYPAAILDGISLPTLAGLIAWLGLRWKRTIGSAPALRDCDHEVPGSTTR